MIRLLGCQEVRPLSGDTEAHNRFVARALPMLAPGRRLGFQGILHGECGLELLVVEVDRCDLIPPGMVAWEINGSRLSILGAGGREPVSHARVKWEWLDTSFGSPRPWIGEPSFSHGPADLPPRLTLTSLSWYEFSPDDVVIQKYDGSWPARYREFARSLGEAFGPEVALRTEHYGSTAIPGMPAKPIIDVLVEVPDFTRARRRILPLVNRPGWEYWWYGDHPMFIHRSPAGVRTHHVHLATHGHRLWEGIAFRDHLRAHPRDAAEYAELKLRCADSFRGDREAYTAAKESFVRRIAALTGATPADRL